MLYGAAALLLVPLAIGIGFLFVDSVIEIMQKRRLVNGVQIMAAVTDRESNFNVIRGGGFSSYEIDYEFRYTDSQTGQLKKQIRTNYEVYQSEYETFTPGSTFVATFIPGEPTINEPVDTAARLSPQTVLLVRLIASLIVVGMVGTLISKFSRIFERFERSKKAAIIAALSLVALVVGLMVGGSIARLLELALF